MACCARTGRDLSAQWRNTRPRDQEYLAQDTQQVGGALSGGESAKSPVPPPGGQMPASQPDLLAVSSAGQRGEDGGGTNGGRTPRGVEQGAGGGPMTSFPGWGYISGSGRARLCCSYCSVGTLCREAGGWTDRRTHTDSATPIPALAPAVAHPAPPVQPPRAQVPTVPGPRPPEARRPGFAMRSAAVLALLLCAGQGERSVGERVLGAPLAPALPALRPGPAQRPRPSVPPLRAASFSTADSARLPPDPARSPGPRTRRPDPWGWTPDSARQAPRCPHLIPGLGVRAASGSAPWLAKVIGGDGRAAALPLSLFHPTALPSSCP